MANLIVVETPCTYCGEKTRYESNGLCTCKSARYAQQQKVYNERYYHEKKGELKRNRINKDVDVRAATIRRAIEERQEQKRIDNGEVLKMHWHEENGTATQNVFDSFRMNDTFSKSLHNLGEMLDAF